MQEYFFHQEKINQKLRDILLSILTYDNPCERE